MLPEFVPSPSPLATIAAAILWTGAWLLDDPDDEPDRNYDPEKVLAIAWQAGLHL
jgi:hypothetical protein